MKKTNLIRKNFIYIAAFLLPVSIMLLIFIIRKIFPFGEQSFLHIDMYHQYFPFLTEYFHKLKSGDSLLYSFHAGLGSNFIDLIGYYLATPFNFLAVFVPEAYLIEFMSYLVIFKIGLCSVSFTYYFVKHFQTKQFSILFFALAYSLSGYLAAYNWDVMWLDCIILAPLIFLGLEALVKEGKWKLYCITLALSIITNYYLSILICIFITFYFIALWLSAEKKGIVFLRFAGVSLLAAGIAGIVLVPAFEMLRQSEYSQSNFPSKMKSYFPLLDVFARHLANVQVETGLDNWPNIYCGVMVLVLFPLYTMCRQIPYRERIAKSALLLFCLVSFSNNVLTFIWHGFNYPSSLPSRQSFLYILLLLTVCYEAFLHWDKFKPSIWMNVTAGVVLFLLFSEKLVTDDAFGLGTYILSAGALFAYALLFHYFRKNALPKKLLFSLTLIVVMTELGFNMFFTSVPTVSRTRYLENYNTYKDIVRDYESNDTSFFRIDKEHATTQNDAMLNGFSSPDMFSSTTNSYVNDFYEKYGMRSSRVFYSSQGMTPLTSALLVSKYRMTDKEKKPSSLYHLLEERDGIYMYENTYTLPLGFMVDTIVPTASNVPQNPIEEQNVLAEKLGSKEALFYTLPVSETNLESTIYVDESSYVYAYIDESKVKTAKAYVDGEVIEFEKLKNSYILDLGFKEAGTEIIIKAEDLETPMPLELSAYSFSEAIFSNLMHDLQEEAFVVDSHSSAKIEGHITVKKDASLFLSIPYEPNWHVLVDGNEIETTSFEKAFLSFPLTAGEHTITMTYKCPALTIGMILSILSIIIFIMIIWGKRLLKARKSTID